MVIILPILKQPHICSYIALVYNVILIYKQNNLYAMSQRAVILLSNSCLFKLQKELLFI